VAFQYIHGLPGAEDGNTTFLRKSRNSLSFNMV